MKLGDEKICGRCQASFTVGTVFDFPTYEATWHECKDGVMYQVTEEKSNKRKNRVFN